MKLKNKFSLIMLTSIIVPLFLLSAISINMFSKNLLEQNKNVVKMINFSLHTQFEEFKKNTQNTLNNFSSSKALETAVYSDEYLGKISIESVKKQAESLLKSYPHIKNIVVLNDNGDFLVNSFSDLKKEDLNTDYFYDQSSQEFLMVLKKSFRGGIAFFMVDTTSFVEETLVNLQLNEGTHLFIADTVSKNIVLHNKFTNLSADELKNEAFYVEMLKKKTGFLEYTFKDTPRISYIKEYNGKIFGVSLSESTIFSVIKHIKNIIYAFIIACAIISMIISLSFSKYLVTPILEFGDNMKKLSEGIIAEKLYINTRDEIEETARNYNKFIDKFKNMIIEIKEGATTIANSTNNMKGAHEKLVEKSTDQALEIKYTTENIREISSIVRANTEKTLKANKITESTEKRTEKVGGMSIDLKSSIDKINESSGKMQKIVEVIDEISFQTNLLSINAAVEAANTGEEGRGFAVVSTEVRNLSKRSSKAANEIKTLIQENVLLVSEGSKIVDTTIHELQDIVNEAKRVNEVISNLAESVNEQQEGIEHINKTIEKLNEVTRMNTWIAEETSSSTDVLYDKSNKFLKLVNFFQISK